MLTNDDKLTIQEIFKEEVDRIEIKIDRVLKIVTRSDQEHTLTKTKVNQHDKRLRKIEKKLKIASPATTSVFA
ncbi:MAG: hypothetical protein V1487_02400 [bacterium]